MVVCSGRSAGSNKEVVMQTMGRIGIMGLGIVLLGCLSGAPVFAEEKSGGAIKNGPKVVITSPKDGDKVSDSFDLKYELTKGSHPTHVHVYVDDEYQKGFSGTLKGLSKGTHQITVKGATKDHDVVAASHTITVEVE
jgi:Bacterial Ig domain